MQLPEILKIFQNSSGNLEKIRRSWQDLSMENFYESSKINQKVFGNIDSHAKVSCNNC